jgi:hypothetical protein
VPSPFCDRWSSYRRRMQSLGASADDDISTYESLRNV